MGATRKKGQKGLKRKETGAEAKLGRRLAELERWSETADIILEDFGRRIGDLEASKRATYDEVGAAKLDELLKRVEALERRPAYPLNYPQVYVEQPYWYRPPEVWCSTTSGGGTVTTVTGEPLKHKVNIGGKL